MEASVDNEVIVNTNGTVEVAVGNAANAVVADDHALDITVTKKEYKIVGDEVYIAKLYEDAPQWMKDLVQLVVDNTMETESATLRNDLIRQLNQFATSYVPLNSYTQSILDLSNADTAMHDTLETLNSNFNDGLDTANSQIIDLQSTKASKTEVATKVIETLTAQLATPTSELGAIIGNLQQTIVDGDSANADSVTTLMSVLEGEVDARASAIETINTYVGIDEAGASTGTGLSAYLEGSDGTIGGADSQVANSVAIVGGVPTSKWQYNSALVVNGTTYNSGFGLSNSAGTGIGSEFWIDASRFKFTNSAKTGSTAPFTIDASGATPQITFNGRVSFSNVTGTPTHTSGLLVNRPAAPVAGSTYTATDQDNQIYTYTNVGWIAGGDPDALTAADLGASGTTVIDGARITTGSVTASQIAAGSITADRLSSTSGTSTIWSGGGLVSSNFNGNVVGSIGTPTKGFRLSSNAAGTSADPSIYGAYIKGGILDGATLTGQLLDISNMKVSNGSANTADFNISLSTYTANSGLRLYGKNYSVGHIPERLVSSIQKIHVQASASYSYGTGNQSTGVTVKYSLDGGAWINITSHTISSYVMTSTVQATAVGSLAIDPTTFNTLDVMFVPSGSGWAAAYVGGYLSVSTTNL